MLNQFCHKQNNLILQKLVTGHWSLVTVKELGSHALQATVKRVDFAFRRFFSGIGGYPKFKSSRYYRGWTYPDNSGWKVHSTRHLQELRSNSITRFEMLAIIHKCDRFKRNNKALAYLSTLN